MLPKAQYKAFLLIFLVALALRLPYALTRPDALEFPDSQDYDSTARNLLAGEGFREESGRQASRAPGYPLFLSGCYAAGLSFRGVYVIQSIADAITCVLVALLGRNLFGMKAGVAAGLACAVYPFFIFFSGILLSETLFTLALVAAVALLERALRGKKWRTPVLLAATAGIVIGFAIHLRSSFLLFPLFMVPFWIVAQRRDISRRCIRATGLWIVMAAMAGMALLPWVVRNYRIFGRIIPATLQVGESLYEANSPYADGGPAMDRIDWVAERGGVMMGEYDNNEFFKQKALDYIRQNPGRFISLALEKMRRFWNPLSNYGPYRRPIYSAVALAANVPVYALAILWLFRMRRRWRETLFLLTPVLYYAGMHAVFVGSIRYRIPVMPFIIVLAAAGLWSLFGGGIAENREAVHGERSPE